MTGEQREEYGRMLSSTEDDVWMEGLKRRSALGSERFVQSLRVQDGRFRRKRGRPAKCANKGTTH